MGAVTSFIMFLIILLARSSFDGIDTAGPESAAFFLYDSLSDSDKSLHFCPTVRKASAPPPICSVKLNERTAFSG